MTYKPFSVPVATATAATTATKPQSVAIVANVAVAADPTSELRAADEDLQVAFAERAAISEVDGGLPRSHAELIALTCTVPLGPGETLESRDAVVIHFAAHLDRLRRRRVLPAREPGDAA